MDQKMECEVDASISCQGINQSECEEVESKENVEVNTIDAFTERGESTSDLISSDVENIMELIVNDISVENKFNYVSNEATANMDIINVERNPNSDADLKLDENLLETSLHTTSNGSETLSIHEDKCMDMQKDLEGDSQINHSYQKYRSRASEDEVSDSTASSETSSDDEPAVEKDEPKEPPKPQNVPLRVRGELLYQDLPLLTDLKITIPEDIVLKEIGMIKYCIDTLVIIQSMPATPALDEETIFFLDNKTALGQVFEIFGPVPSPFYSVRFNTVQDIQDQGIKPGTRVFYAPHIETFTKFVFIQQLKEAKGSDASWLNDIEPPANCVDYSDDEQERAAKNKKKNKKKNDQRKNEENSIIKDNSIIKENSIIKGSSTFKESNARFVLRNHDNFSKNSMNSHKPRVPSRQNFNQGNNRHSNSDQWPPEKEKTNWTPPAASECIKSSFGHQNSMNSGTYNQNNSPIRYHNRHRSSGNPFEQSQMYSVPTPTIPRFSGPPTYNNNQTNFTHHDNSSRIMEPFKPYRKNDENSFEKIHHSNKPEEVRFHGNNSNSNQLFSNRSCNDMISYPISQENRVFQDNRQHRNIDENSFEKIQHSNKPEEARFHGNNSNSNQLFSNRNCNNMNSNSISQENRVFQDNRQHRNIDENSFEKIQHSNKPEEVIFHGNNSNQLFSNRNCNNMNTNPVFQENMAFQDNRQDFNSTTNSFSNDFQNGNSEFGDNSLDGRIDNSYEKTQHSNIPPNLLSIDIKPEEFRFHGNNSNSNQLFSKRNCNNINSNPFLQENSVFQENRQHFNSPTHLFTNDFQNKNRQSIYNFGDNNNPDRERPPTSFSNDKRPEESNFEKGQTWFY